MLRFAPRASVVLAFSCLGCGRLGFDLLYEQGTDPARAVDVGDAGGPGAAADGDVDARDAAARGGGDGDATSDASRSEPDAGTGDEPGDPGPGPASLPPRAPSGDFACAGGELLCDEIGLTTQGTIRSLNASASNDVTGSVGGELATGVFHGTTTGSGSEAAIDWPFAAQSSGVLYVRARLGLTSGAPFVGATLLRLATSEGGPGLELRILADAELALFTTEGERTIRSGVSMPLGTWVCFDAMIALADVGRAALWRDGTPVLDVGMDTFPSGGVSTISAGLAWTDAQQGPAEILVDEVAVSASALPTCP